MKPLTLTGLRAQIEKLPRRPPAYSRENVEAMAREQGILDVWAQDVDIGRLTAFQAAINELSPEQLRENFDDVICALELWK